MGVLVALELLDALGVDAARVADGLQRLVHHQQAPARPQHPEDLRERAAQTRVVVVVEDLAAVHVVHAARRERNRIHRPENPLEEDLSLLEEVVRRVQALKLDGGDVERDGAQPAFGKVVRRPACVRADVEDALPLPSGTVVRSWCIERACTYQ